MKPDRMVSGRCRLWVWGQGGGSLQAVQKPAMEVLQGPPPTRVIDNQLVHFGTGFAVSKTVPLDICQIVVYCGSISEH